MARSIKQSAMPTSPCAASRLGTDAQKKSGTFLFPIRLRKMGLEPTRCTHHKILSLARLPVPTLPRIPD